MAALNKNGSAALSNAAPRSGAGGSLRIGLMLRSLDERGGVGVYTRYLLQELLALDHTNHYVLFYAHAGHLGRYAHHPNVTEVVVGAWNKAAWDQWAIPLACRKHGVDVVFHPKFTAPLLAPCKVVMVLHGADWFIPAHARFYGAWDVRYMKLMMPLYLWKCARVVSVSQITTDEFERIFRTARGKVQTIYFGPGKHFHRVDDAAVLSEVKGKYRLPDQFILTLSGYDRGRRKNIDRILDAYRLFHGATPHKLVVGGRDCDKFRGDFNIPSGGWGGDIVFPGWIEQEDLPAVYSMASVYLYPSNLEAFPIPLTEAMACETPIVTSSLNGLKEIAGEAALFVDADDPGAIAAGVRRVLTDASLRQELQATARQRSRMFDWEKCARETLDLLNAVGRRAERA